MTDISKPQIGNALLGALLMIAAGAIFAAINTLVQLATMTHGIASTKVAFWQYLIALGFYVPWLWTNLARSLATSNIVLHIIRVLLAAGGVQLWVYGLSFVPIWQAIALIMLSPFFVTLGAGLVLREQVTAQRWLAVAIGFIGGMIILSPWSDTFTVKALYPVGAAMLWAFSSLLTKHMTESESPETLTIYLLLLLTPINALVTFNAGFALPVETSLGIIVAAGALTAAAQYALVKAYSVADAAYLQPFDHLKLPLNVLLGFLVFGFLPGGSMWLGSAMIVGGSLFLLREEA
jgi:S-adenosylmethionine uptake transporter